MVGDTITDMELGRNAGCRASVGVIGGASTVKDVAFSSDVLVSDLTKLVKLLDSLYVPSKSWREADYERLHKQQQSNGIVWNQVQVS